MPEKRNVTYKCLYCDNRFNRNDLVIHVGEEHEDMIPAGFTPFRLVFNYVNKKPLSYHGKCTECGGPTPWDEKKGRYDRQCTKKSCHDSYVKKFEENMMKTRGVTRISATAAGQEKMLANRSISGVYKFQDGCEKTYCGSYERKALEFMDKVMNIKSSDILCPGPILEYQHNGKTHIYITDFYYQPYNLIIEVKDGGDNPNKRSMPEYRQKQIEKEQYIIKNTNYNYLRLTNNDLEQLLLTFMDLKMQMVENNGDRVIHVNEADQQINSINEYMNALMSGKVVGMRDSDAYIINYPQNRVFADDNNEKMNIAVTDGNFSNIVFCDKDDNNKLKVKSGKDIDWKNTAIYRCGTKNDVSKLLAPYIGESVSDNFIYEKITGKKLYTIDQLECTLERFIYDDVDIKSMLESYILGNKEDEIKALEETVREVINNG